ncbi:MAG: hypothetical protein MI976_19775 [Pseudomonadales bacterium]|nr:hypothetical protein [Pseudomonadales bacterium]
MQINTYRSMVDSLSDLRKNILEKDSNSVLSKLDEITIEDFINTELTEESLYCFAEKLGFCHPYIDSENESTFEFDENYSKERVAYMSVVKAIDKEKNILKKPGCGVYLSKENANELFTKSEGVYGLYYSAGIVDDAGNVPFVKAGLRVSHTLHLDDASVIRVKLNIPNAGNAKARYQYRGYMIPVGEEHVNLTLNLARATINKELHNGSFEKQTNTDIVNLTSTALYQAHKTVYRGILASLSQRDHSNQRMPYASKALLFRKKFNGTPDEIFQQERLFMTDTGLGFYDSLEALLLATEDEKEYQFVSEYFNDEVNKKSQLVSTKWPLNAID